MNKRKCYLVVVTSAKTTTRAVVPLAVSQTLHIFHIAMTWHWFYVISRSSHHLWQTFRQKKYFCLFWSLEPLLRYSMIFALADEISVQKTPSTKYSQRLSKLLTRVLSAGSSARMFKRTQKNRIAKGKLAVWLAIEERVFSTCCWRESQAKIIEN